MGAGVLLDQLAQARDLHVEARSKTSYSRPRASSISLSRDSGTRGCCASTLSTENSPVVNCVVVSPRASSRGARFRGTLPKSTNSFAGGAPGCAGGARWRRNSGMNARQQFARVERLGQVVVGAHLEADDAVDVVALSRSA